MSRNSLSPFRNTRWLTFVCIASICMNVAFIILTGHAGKGFVKHEARVDSMVEKDFYKSQNSESNVINNSVPVEIPLVTSFNASGVVQFLHQPLKEPDERPVDCTLCPFDPPNLLGPLADLSKDINLTTLELLFPQMKSARIQPTDCFARQKIAIIIPYRNRYPHLHILLHNLIPFLIRQQADATFFVIDQALPEIFNRGALLNVGFLEAEKITKFDCYIFHDVDLIPLDDRHMYRCGDNPKHFAVAMNKYKFRLPYSNYFGGAVGFSRRQYMDINGCSNMYFGWGGEDDEMNERVLNKGYQIHRATVKIARYNMIKHKRDKGNEINSMRKRILSSVKKRQDFEGLNTIVYQINSINYEKFYIWINVILNQTAILQNSPQHVLDTIFIKEKKTAKPIKKPVLKVTAQSRNRNRLHLHKTRRVTRTQK